MKLLFTLILLFSFYSCTERDNEEIVETGLDFAKEIEKIPPQFNISLPALAETIPNELTKQGVLWFPEVDDDVSVTCTSIVPMY